MDRRQSLEEARQRLLDMPLEEARQMLLNMPVEQRVQQFNETAEEEADPWRYVVHLPHEDFVRMMRNRTAAVKNFSGARVTDWMTSSERLAFSLMFTAYFLVPHVALLTLAIILRNWSILIGIPLALISVPFAGAPKKSLIRSALILAAVICAAARGVFDRLTLILGIPAIAALIFRWADSFGEQSMIRFLVRNADGYDELVDKGLVMVLVDSRTQELAKE